MLKPRICLVSSMARRVYGKRRPTLQAAQGQRLYALAATRQWSHAVKIPNHYLSR